MYQGESFHQVHVESKLRGNGAGNLGNFNGMSQAVPKVVGITASEDLGFCFKAAERAGMDNAVAVSLEIISIGVGRLGEATSARTFHAHGVIGEHAERIALLIFDC